MKLQIKHFFDASHQLPDTEYLVSKGCARLHGHTYAVQVTLESEELKGGMVVDFRAVKDIIDELDHQHVNDIFKKDNYDKESSAENIALWLVKRIKEDLGFTAVVAICEGYKGAEKASWAVSQ